MEHRRLSLDDRYQQREGDVLLTGIQALVRLAIDQHRRDKAAGQKTAGFISGYRGSPLGGLDLELGRAKALLTAENIVFQPGVNEELGATAVWGSQQTNLFPGAKFEGTFGLWYGKAPGVDRAGDVFRHANAAGTSPLGGVIALCGDDHDCKSSTLPSQSDYAMMHAEIPVLNPASVQDVLDFGHFAIALSRYSGLWTSMIALADTMDSAAKVEVTPDRLRFVLPTDFAMPTSGVHIRLGDVPVQQEERVRSVKLPAALAFARANGINRMVMDSPTARFGIIATGRAYEDLRQAMAVLGLDENLAATLGLRIMKVGMPWPLDAHTVRGFARGLQKLLVIESKRPVMEDQLRGILYDLAPTERPAILGKKDAEGRPLLSDTRALSAAGIARALLQFLPDERLRRPAETWFAAIAAQESMISALPAQAARTPFYCSGCPHNTSTRLPEGTRGMAGIGCHYMVTWMDRDTHLFSQMGGEGVHWVGQQAFTNEPHMFVNLGDGTYFHSGTLAIRQAVAAKLNITYKILYNDAVAMTGGQAVDGPLTPQIIARQVLAEGVAAVRVVADDPSRYGATPDFPAGVSIAARERLDAIQKELRATPGVTVLIYDQVCAAEKRRRRKRGLMDDPPKRLFINDAVCEGCGDCSVKSNCISVEPVETEFGRMRRINQSSCNKDYSCAKGFCPSFVEITGAQLRKHTAAGITLDDAGLPEPSRPPLDRLYNIFITGIGGTGVTTVASILSHAAFIERKGGTELNMTGLAQKGGAVTSHLRLAPTPEEVLGPRIPAASADVLIACDAMVAVTGDALRLLRRDLTAAVVNADVAPTAAFVRDPKVQYDGDGMVQVLRNSTRQCATVDATRLAELAIGDALYGNMLQLGYAYQQGLIPLSATAIHAAITLNGAQVQKNLDAFNLGRRLAHTPTLAEKILPAARGSHQISETLEQRIGRREELLTAYQSKRYAKRFRALVDKVRQAEAALDGRTELTEAVVRGFAKLMAYKDEYEVARLYAAPEYQERLKAQFEGSYSMRILLAPPLFSKRDPDTGHLIKRSFGSWVLKFFPILARFRFLRGTVFDLCGQTAERAMERRLRDTYEKDLRAALPTLTSANKATVVELAKLPDDIRGFGHIKKASVQRTESRRQELLKALSQNSAPLQSAAE